MKKTCIFCLAAMVAVLAAGTQAEAIIRVEAHGTVEWNQFIDGPFYGTVQPGDSVVMIFDVCSDNYEDPPYYPPPSTCHTRGYKILPESFFLRIGSVDVPRDAGAPGTPYFVLRNNDPGSDGVKMSSDPCGNSDGGMVLDLAGASGGTFVLTFWRTFEDGNSPVTVFNSLDIAQAVGYWEYEWMSEYSFSIAGGGGTPLGMNYDWFSMTQIAPLQAPPVITAQPVSVTEECGNNATFMVEATDAVSYAWWYDDGVNGPVAVVDTQDGYGTTIAGSSTKQLTIYGVGPRYAGSYYCVVSNGCGNDPYYASVTTDTVQLTVTARQLPEILTQPAAFTQVCQDGTATFHVDASGPVLYYVWWYNDGVTPARLMHDGLDVYGATVSGTYTATLRIQGVKPGHAGYYYCEIWNGCDASDPANVVTTDLAQLGVSTPGTAPQIFAQPVPVTLQCPSGTAAFSVVANSVALYAWWFDDGVNPAYQLFDGPDMYGATISGSATANLSIENVNTNHAGAYYCVLWNGCDFWEPSNSATTSPAQLSFLTNACAFGDMNCDQALTIDDVPGFIQALVNPESFSGCNILNGDINLDGLVDGADIDPFVHLLVP
jgi:hypothetical protein